jgi:flagellar motor protein MotB
VKRRYQLTVWPAVADLMTVLAVSGLFGCLALLPHAQEKGDLVEKLRAVQREKQKLEKDLEAAEKEAKEQEQVKEDLEQQVREAAKNQQMSEAIQRAQEVVDQVSADESLRFEADQTLRFGDDLVKFAPSSFLPDWQAEGRTKLREFCQELSRRLAGRTGAGPDLRNLFTVQVEGHTDTTGCPGDPNCNWWISAARAAVFVALMRQDDYCPGGASLDLHPVGYADTRPPGENPNVSREERRRISVRLVPDYRRIIRSGLDP